MIKVIDASVAIKWFVPQEEDRSKALAVLDHLQQVPQDYAVPELFFNEMLAVLCRLLSQAKLIAQYMQDLQELGLSRLGNGRQTIAEAVRLAKEFRLSGYDAIYAANALLVQGVWITADRVAHKKLRSNGISRLLSDV